MHTVSSYIWSHGCKKRLEIIGYVVHLKGIVRSGAIRMSYLATHPRLEIYDSLRRKPCRVAFLKTLKVLSSFAESPNNYNLCTPQKGRGWVGVEAPHRHKHTPTELEKRYYVSTLSRKRSPQRLSLSGTLIMSGAGVRARVGGWRNTVCCHSKPRHGC